MRFGRVKPLMKIYVSHHKYDVNLMINAQEKSTAESVFGFEIRFSQANGFW